MRWLDEEPLAPPKPLSVGERLQQRTSPGEWQNRARDLGKSAVAVWNYTTENNLSLAHVGRLDEALERMQTIERAAPGHLETAYNMATVYELRGDLPGAKKWLEEGFRRERGVTGRAPLDGTKWLHERILDAEMQPSKGAASVAGLDFGAAKTPQMPSDFPSGLDDKPVDFALAKRSLFEQLHERLEFVWAPNPIVGDLLLDLANAQALEGANSTPGEDSGVSNDEQVAQLLQQALVYGTPRADEARRRLAYYFGQPN